MNYIRIKNSQTILLSDIPESNYESFYDMNLELVTGHIERHCVNYFGYKSGNNVKLICCIADDSTHDILVSTCLVNKAHSLESFTAKQLCFEKFEREIHENFGVNFPDHPWLKPVRYAFNRDDKSHSFQSIVKSFMKLVLGLSMQVL